MSLVQVSESTLTQLCIVTQILLFNSQLMIPYLAATCTATVTALTLNQIIAKVSPLCCDGLVFNVVTCSGCLLWLDDLFPSLL